MTSTLVIDAHPNPNSFTTALVAAYADAHPSARVIALRDLDFDVHMRFGYTERMEIEPDLADARAAMREARHLVVVTPVWWRSVPALLKGFNDRALLPKQDYRYRPSGIPQGLLTGRSARVIITSDTPLWLQPFMPDTRLRSFSHGTLGFCGFSPVQVTRFASVKTSTGQQRESWLERVRDLARRDAARVPRQGNALLANAPGSA